MYCAEPLRSMDKMSGIELRRCILTNTRSRVGTVFLNSKTSNQPNRKTALAISPTKLYSIPKPKTGGPITRKNIRKKENPP